MATKPRKKFLFCHNYDFIVAIYNKMTFLAFSDLLIPSLWESWIPVMIK